MSNSGGVCERVSNTEACPLATQRDCKPYSRLNALLGDEDSLDSFIFRTTGYNSIRILNVIDEANREYLSIEVSPSIPSTHLIRVLDYLIDYFGVPDAIRLDNDLEMVSKAFTDWAADKGIRVRFIQPGKPNQNAFIEQFNRTYRTEVLNTHLFDTLEQAPAMTERWLVDYNEYRPHESLGDIPPVHYIPRLTRAPSLYLELST